MTPPSNINTLLNEWETEAILHKGELYVRDDVPDFYARKDQDRILTLISLVRSQQEALLTISTLASDVDIFEIKFQIECIYEVSQKALALKVEGLG